MDIYGKNILITGSNRGIGLAMAKKAAQLNSHVHMLCRSPDLKIKEQLIALGAQSVCFWELDLSDPGSIDKFVQNFSASKISPDILINNAGQLTGGLLEKQSVEKIYQMFSVNLVGLIHLTKALLPMMLKLDQAKIVNNSSVSGLMYLPCASTYAASKAGVIAFTESLRNELSGTDVTTLVLITPGVKTRMFDEISNLYSDNLDLKFISSIPAEDWVQRVFQHIKQDKNMCWPSGKSYIGVKIGQHMPNVLSRMIKGYFKR